MEPPGASRSYAAPMSALHPRQRLVRETVIVAALAALILAGAACWAAIALPSQPPSVPTAQAPTDATASLPPPPRAILWRALSDAPAAAPAPPAPPPTFRLITLSHRDQGWVALIDPGGGQPMQRVNTGDSVAGWKVDAITADSVDLSNAGRTHRLGLAP